jgi:membrane associated rhomboid family serine protease
MPPQLKRLPVLTLAVVAVAVVTGALAVASPTVLAHLQRTPGGLHGQWWRTLTSLFMQSSAAGAASNLFFMLVLGVVAEQVASRYLWLACYFGAGVVGELAGYAWQPTGAGNSVAVCGLAGLIALACWRRDSRLPAFGAFSLLLWCAVLLSTWAWPAAVVGAVCAMAGLRLQAAGWRHVGAFAVAVTFASGVFLACVLNIHGPALLAGLAFAAMLGGVARGPLRSHQAESSRSGTASPPRSDVATDPTDRPGTAHFGPGIEIHSRLSEDRIKRFHLGLPLGRQP